MMDGTALTGVLREAKERHGAYEATDLQREAVRP